jgi:septal ring factor EnvC (AmiA/AmiB activator)
MDEITLTQLFAKMDDHLAQQDAYLREAQAANRKMDAHLARQDAQLAVLTEGLRESNAALARTGQLLATTAKDVAAIHAEASRRFEETMRKLEALTGRLEGRG